MPRARPNTRPNTRHNTLPRAWPDTRSNTMPRARPNTRPNTRHNTRPASRPNTRSNARPNTRPNTRPNARPNAWPDTRRGDPRDARPNAPHEARHGAMREPGADRGDVRAHVRVVEVQATVAIPPVPGLGDGQRDHRDLRPSQTFAPGREIRARQRLRHRPLHEHLVSFRAPHHQRIPPVLPGQFVGERAGPPGERRDAPGRGVRRRPGVPGLVRAEEATKSKVDYPDRRHSLKTRRG